MFETRTWKGRVLLQVVLTLALAPFVVPLVVMIQGSLIGKGFETYLVVLSQPELPIFFRNSLIIAAITIAIVTACSVLAAFAFSKLHLRGRETLFWLLLVCLTLPEVVLITPLFATTLELGIYNTFAAVILPLAALQIPFAVLLARTFMDGIPSELMDAARMDGASTVKVFLHIILPLMRPIAATIIVFVLIGSWNNYLLPLVFLNGPESGTITLLPQFYQSQFTYDQTKILASAVVTALPEVVAYLALQRFFERGLAAGALK